MKKKLSRPVWWMVISPEYDVNGGYETPPEPTRDVLWVFACSKNRAKTLATRAWRRNWTLAPIPRRKQPPWIQERGGCGGRMPYIVAHNEENPMAVLTVERARFL